MHIQLISHASVVVETKDACIWTDPWLFGTAFNDSWSLLPPARFEASLYDRINYLWISHEHPDHFHIPTLKSLPLDFKKRVILLFQENNSDKMGSAFQRLGFRNIEVLQHRCVVRLSKETSVYCYQQGQMNSALAVMAENESVLNINDAELNSRDCRIICKDIGPVAVVLNQFSIAGYAGYQDHKAYLPRLAEKILANMSDNHRDLGAQVTIPFASFIYFSAEDNKYINNYANKPRDVQRYFAARDQRTVVLYPGDVYTYGSDSADSSARAIMRYDECYRDRDKLGHTLPTCVPIEDVAQAFYKLADHIHAKYPRLLLSLLKPVSVYVPDVDQTVEFSILQKTFSALPGRRDCSLIVNSQPLHFAFAFPYGVQTLGVSARFTLLNNPTNWKRHRILFSLNNAELYVKPKYFFTRSNLRWFKRRVRGSLNQFKYQKKRMQEQTI
jgi:UDP-MurNAc hydroxylase